MCVLVTSPYDLNLRHLEAAAGIARLGGIGLAAASVNLSQPALTQALAALERKLGHRLFDRHPAGMAPTEAGALLAARVDRAAAYLADAVRVLPARTLPNAVRHVGMAQLRALIAVQRAGSFAGAAAACGLSQPAIHRAARELEALLGVALLVRDGRMIRPTQAALLFVRPARLAIAEVEAALAELSALSEGGGGTVTVGTMPLAQASLLPRAIVRFCAQHPTARVRVVDGAYPELLAGLRGGEIDLLIGATRHNQPNTDIAEHPLFEAEAVIAARAGHPLTGGPPARAELARYPWVVAPEGTPLRARWQALMGGAALPPAVTCSAVVTIRGLLLEGDFLTLLSPDQFYFERQAGLLAAIGAPLAGSMRHIGITTRAGWQPTRLQRGFLAMLHDVAAHGLPQTQWADEQIDSAGKNARLSTTS